MKILRGSTQRPNDTTAYAMNDHVGGPVVFENDGFPVARLVETVNVTVSTTKAWNKDLRLHFFDGRVPPGDVSGDNEALEVDAKWADKYLGSFDILGNAAMTNFSVLFADPFRNEIRNRVMTPPGPFTVLLQAREAMTPVANMIFNVMLGVSR